LIVAHSKMVGVTFVSRVALATVLLAVATLACDDARGFRLNSGNQAVRISLNRIKSGETVRACVDVNVGRRVDWYFTSYAASRDWMTIAAIHYAFSPNTPFNQPPSVVYQSRIATSGFTLEFDVSDSQASNANEEFAIIIHATSDCLGGNECVVAAAQHLLEANSIVVLIIVIVICVAICFGIAGCVYCCCFRNRDQQQPGTVQQAPAQGIVVNTADGTEMQQMQQQPAAYPPQLQYGQYPQHQHYQQQSPQGYPPQQQGYPPQQQGYPPQQQGYPPADQGYGTPQPPPQGYPPLHQQPQGYAAGPAAGSGDGTQGEQDSTNVPRV
jgi:hypothetical protein